MSASVARDRLHLKHACRLHLCSSLLEAAPDHDLQTHTCCDGLLNRRPRTGWCRTLLPMQCCCCCCCCSCNSCCLSGGRLLVLPAMQRMWQPPMTTFIFVTPAQGCWANAGLTADARRPARRRQQRVLLLLAAQTPVKTQVREDIGCCDCYGGAINLVVVVSRWRNEARSRGASCRCRGRVTRLVCVFTKGFTVAISKATQ